MPDVGLTTYSFADVNAALVGPNGSVILGNGSGADDEGISAEYAEDKNTQVKSADGDVMNTLHASRAGLITFRLVKTSPTNSILSAMYNAQQESSLLWGQNTIVVSDVARGDVITGSKCAFKKGPRVVYGKEGPMLEWAIDVGNLNMQL